MAYSILFKQCGSDHMTRGRSRAIDRIVVHFTATLASARNNATYFARNEGQGASAHYFVDDITGETLAEYRLRQTYGNSKQTNFDEQNNK